MSSSGSKNFFDRIDWIVDYHDGWRDMTVQKKNSENHLAPLRVVTLWLLPILLIVIYDFATYLLQYYPSHHIPLPAPSTVTSLTLFGILASPLWVLVGYSFTYFFGSFGVTHLIKLFANGKFLRRKLVIQPKAELERIYSNPDATNLGTYLSSKSFSLTLGLVLVLNLAYTLLIIRYFQSFFVLPRKVAVYQYLLSLRFISVEFLLALLFLPLLTIVMPILIGRVRIRQIDSSPLQNYWLSYVYSAAGGASAVLLLLNIFEHNTATAELIISSLFVYGIVSWYTTIGINLAIPLTEKKLAAKLSKWGEKENIFFGKIFVGTRTDDAKEV
jgi:hypothetical protein